MKLIGFYISLFVCKVCIVLVEKKIEYNFVIDLLWLEDSVVFNINLFGKIFVLVFDDEMLFFDFWVIVEYIDNVIFNNKFYLVLNCEWIEVKCWEVVVDGICDVVVMVFFEVKCLKVK